MPPIIEVAGLQKRYGGVRGRSTIAVDALDLQVDEPGVHGFLGPNGSGKTTTIRCLLGLVRPTAGSVRLFGEDVTDRRSLARVIGRVGALVEGPKFTPEFTARRNLDLLARPSGIDRRRVDDALIQVDLLDHADEPVRTFSLGMAQRLGVAAALLKDPDLLVLDEPNNGLDPAGIADMRRLLRRLAERGVTVLLSSHQLTEVQATCDEVLIISRGRHVMTGSVGEIVSAVSSNRHVVTIARRDRAVELLTRSGFDATVGTQKDQLVVQLPPSLDPSLITQALASDRLYVSSLRADGVSLEEAFLSLTTTPVSGRSPSVESPPSDASLAGVA